MWQTSYHYWLLAVVFYCKPLIFHGLQNDVANLLIQTLNLTVSWKRLTAKCQTYKRFTPLKLWIYWATHTQMAKWRGFTGVAPTCLYVSHHQFVFHQATDARSVMCKWQERSQTDPLYASVRTNRTQSRSQCQLCKTWGAPYRQYHRMWQETSLVTSQCRSGCWVPWRGGHWRGCRPAQHPGRYLWMYRQTLVALGASSVQEIYENQGASTTSLI